jgi:aldehyde:ferredoxin oxidoreductase
MEKSADQMVEAADRIWTLTRSINAREGFNRKDDVIPDQWFQPLKLTDGRDRVIQDYFREKVLDRKDVEQCLEDYYTERGWDVSSGIPTKEKLTRLGLESIASDL